MQHSGFQAMLLAWDSVSPLWVDHQTHPIFRYSRWGYFPLARNSALPRWSFSFHDRLLTIPSEVSTQTLNRTASGAPIQMRSILRKRRDKKSGLFPHYCFKSSTSFAAPLYKSKKQTKPCGNRWSKLTQVAHPSHGLEFWSAIEGEQNTKVTSRWDA